MRFHRFCKALTPKFFALRVLRFSHTIRIKYKQFAGTCRQIILMITSVPEHSQRNAATLDEAVISILIEQYRRVVAGVCVGQGFVSDIEYAVKGCYKLITLDGFPEQVVNLRHRNMWRISDMSCRPQTRAQKRHQ